MSKQYTICPKRVLEQAIRLLCEALPEDQDTDDAETMNFCISELEAIAESTELPTNMLVSGEY